MYAHYSCSDEEWWCIECDPPEEEKEIEEFEVLEAVEVYT